MLPFDLNFASVWVTLPDRCLAPVHVFSPIMWSFPNSNFPSLKNFLLKLNQVFLSSLHIQHLKLAISNPTCQLISNLSSPQTFITHVNLLWITRSPWGWIEGIFSSGVPTLSQYHKATSLSLWWLKPSPCSYGVYLQSWRWLTLSQSRLSILTKETSIYLNLLALVFYRVGWLHRRSCCMHEKEHPFWTTLHTKEVLDNWNTIRIRFTSITLARKLR